MTASSINIRPDVRILSVLSHLNYKPWFAIAEFVDNSLQSFFDYRKEIEELEGKSPILRVDIELENSDGSSSRLLVRDNAAGIHQSDYERAFRPAAIPMDRTGLSEFGMGMKSAACWFSPEWSVRTSAIGETEERTVKFDIRKIVNDSIEELSVQTRDVPSRFHYTEIVLSNLHKPPQKKTIAKIKTHLASIYRVFIRQGFLHLYYNGDLLSYSEPAVLESVPHYDTDSPVITKWHKTIDFDFGEGLSASGFAAIRETGSTSEAGFALFRRNRLIQGSGDDTYRPRTIFGASNSFRYQRVFGELHLSGFQVSHTKDGFQWDENEEAFLEILKEHLDEEPIPILRQAEAYRTRQKTRDLRSGAETSTIHTADSIRTNIPPVIERQLTDDLSEMNPPRVLLPDESPVASKTIRAEIFDDVWEIALELSNDPSVGDWVSFSEEKRIGDVRKVAIRVSLAHPFMIQFSGAETTQIEPLQRIAVAIVLAEITARESGVRGANTFRRNINEILRDALSKI